jgi:hypothetical protein
MQTIETGKKNINELLSKYGPVGPRHLLAAALLMHPRDDAKKDDSKRDDKRIGDKTAA